MESPHSANTTQHALKAALQHHQAGRLAEAEAIYRRILEAEPDHADSLHLLGVIAIQSEDHARAIDLIERANELCPSNPVFLSNLAEAYQRLSCPDRAKDCCEQALRLKPDYPAASANLGNALMALGEIDAAEQCYRQAIDGDPSLRAVKLNLGLLRLMRGDYATGFPLYENRLDRAASKGGGDTQQLLDKFGNLPRWRGESLHGKRLLVWTEQGLGDSVMMMRYLPLIKDLGASELVVCCEPALVRLMQSVGEVDDVVSDTHSDDWRERFDFHSPTMSLPLCFGSRLETLPDRIPYLQVPSELKQKWSDKVSSLPYPRVGLVWAGGRQTRADPDRSIPLATLSPILKKSWISFVSLQKGGEASQLAHVGRKLSNWMDECDDLLETAALIEQLDLVISVDTSVAHVAGALGKPVWLLNRFGSEWRWMLERHDSPWYPTMRIFRQQQFHWKSVIQDIADALEHELKPARNSMTPTLLRWIRRLFAR